jgi:hypothetical protein
MPNGNAFTPSGGPPRPPMPGKTSLLFLIVKSYHSGATPKSGTQQEYGLYTYSIWFASELHVEKKPILLCWVVHYVRLHARQQQPFRDHLSLGCQMLQRFETYGRLIPFVTLDTFT